MNRLEIATQLACGLMKVLPLPLDEDALLDRAFRLADKLLAHDEKVPGVLELWQKGGSTDNKTYPSYKKGDRVLFRADLTKDPVVGTIDSELIFDATLGTCYSIALETSPKNFSCNDVYCKVENIISKCP